MRQKILLLDIIVLHANGGESEFLPIGRSIFDAVVREITIKHSYTTNLSTIPLLSPRGVVIDFHSPQIDALGHPYSDEGYRGIGFTYFFLDRAPKTARFSVDPGMGNHITYRIKGYNPTRYAVVCYLNHRYSTETEEWMRQLIAEQILGAREKPTLKIPSESKFIVGADQLTQFISDTFRTCSSADGALTANTEQQGGYPVTRKKRQGNRKQERGLQGKSKVTSATKVLFSHSETSIKETGEELTSGASLKQG